MIAAKENISFSLCSILLIWLLFVTQIKNASFKKDYLEILFYFLNV